MRWFGYLVYLFFSVVLLGELAFWLLPIDRKRPPYDTATIDRELGWKPKGNYLYDGPMQSLNGEEYAVKFTTNENGFRRYPSTVEKDKLQVLVIGDSFTQAVEVSDDEAYYRYFEDSLQAQVYAYGMAGFGTLQELLVLRQYLEEIEPDMVVLQFCSNDFIDNDLSLEQNANYKVGLRRPYWTANDTVAYQHPDGQLAAWLQHTKFLHFCWKAANRIWRSRQIDSTHVVSEEKIAKGRKSDRDYARAVQTTQKLLLEIKQTLGQDIPLVAFCSDVFQPQYGDFQTICQELDIAVLPFPNNELGQARLQEEVFTHDGYHWNARGHQVVGSRLAQGLRPYLP